MLGGRQTLLCVLHDVEGHKLADVALTVRGEDAELLKHLFSRWSIQGESFKVVCPVEDLVIALGLSKEPESPVVGVHSLFVGEVLSNDRLFLVVERVVHDLLPKLMIFVLKFLHLVQEHGFLNHVLLNFLVTHQLSLIIHSDVSWSISFSDAVLYLEGDVLFYLLVEFLLNVLQLQL